MNLEMAKQRLTQNAITIQSMVAWVSLAQARWRPSSDDWSLLEVVNHLYDEEYLDFRLRLGLILQDPALPWPAIHPSAWVTERSYNERDLAESLGDFLRERQASLAWLGELDNPDLTLAAKHPAGFTISAGDMLTSWVAHDMLHIRQLNELHYQWLSAQAQPYSPLYAGEW